MLSGTLLVTGCLQLWFQFRASRFGSQPVVGRLGSVLFGNFANIVFGSGVVKLPLCLYFFKTRPV